MPTGMGPFIFPLWTPLARPGRRGGICALLRGCGGLGGVGVSFPTCENEWLSGASLHQAEICFLIYLATGTVYMKKHYQTIFLPHLQREYTAHFR